MVAVVVFQNKITVSNEIFQHHDGYLAKDCPVVLRNEKNGWANLLDQIKAAHRDLTTVPATALALDKRNRDHHLFG